MTLYEKIEELKYDTESLAMLLLQLDSWLEYLHNNGFCIYDFNPKKIILENGKLTFNSFRNVINNIGISENADKINIFQISKIGLMAYNNMPIDGNMNQEIFNFICSNLGKFNQNGRIPAEIFEYYEEVFQRLNVCYMNDYLLQKQQEQAGRQSTNTIRKVKATPIGTAFADEAAYVNILLLPSILTLLYFIGLFVYTFFIK